MWRRVGAYSQRRCFCASKPWTQANNVIEINNASFFQSYPAATDAPGTNPPLFADLSFALPVLHGENDQPEYWSVLSSSSLARTTFLQILAAQHICIPPAARTYPHLSDIATSPQHNIKYVGFDAERGSSVGGSSVRGAYLSARYESRREETDYSVLDYLTGNTELNALPYDQSETEAQVLRQVVDQLDLHRLLQMPVSNLSNGQTRRVRIAKALMARPEVLLLDGPFMGLDPRTAMKMEQVLHSLAERQAPRLVMSLRPEDDIPRWISHLVLTDENLRILGQGPKNQVLKLTHDRDYDEAEHSKIETRLAFDLRKYTTVDGWERKFSSFSPGEALIEMQGVKIAYGEKVVLGGWKQLVDGEKRPGLWWSLHRGQRCGIFGPNGSGKTTMLSLITSDHPQSYNVPIKWFGRSRLPAPGEAGISLFDIQQRMGHSSPEVHAFFPKHHTVRRVLESAWADAPMAKAKLTAEADRRVDAMLRWFARDLYPSQADETAMEKIEIAGTLPGKRSRILPKGLVAARKVYDETLYDDSDLDWADEITFRELSFSSQRLALFLRALVAQPDLVILDEALSGMDEGVRDKALLFLSHGENCVSYLTTSTKKWPTRKIDRSVLSLIEKVTYPGLSADQALVVISHSKEDVPGCVREWICLPEAGEGKAPRSGTLSSPLGLDSSGWHKIWGKRAVEGR